MWQKRLVFSKPSLPSSFSNNKRSRLTKFSNVVKKTVTNVVFGVGLVTIGVGAIYFWDVEQDDNKRRQRVLVIPFHRLKVHEKIDSSLPTAFAAGLDGSVHMELREIVDLINEAASDPEIVGLHGVFGHGNGFSVGGHGHLEEIRDALGVFRESHRQQDDAEPNKTIAAANQSPTTAADSENDAGNTPRKKIPKTMHAYADSFAKFGDSMNQEYYLASMFRNIHLQERGELNLFGLTASNIFLRDLLYKHGIQAHVFRQGAYKSAPNVFVESGYTAPHIENVLNLLNPLNQLFCENINRARIGGGVDAGDDNKNSKKKEYSLDHWKFIHNSGTLTAAMAKKVGLVDYVTVADPLNALVEYKKVKKEKTKLEQELERKQEQKTQKTTTAIEENKNKQEESLPSQEKAEKKATTTTAIENKNIQEESAPSQEKTEEIENRIREENDVMVKLKKEWDTNFDNFRATETISLTEYRKLLSKRKRWDDVKWQFDRVADDIKRWDDVNWQMHRVVDDIRGKIYQRTRNDRKTKSWLSPETIALIHIDGIIDSRKAESVLASLRQIQKDATVKSVVVRVNSSGGSPEAAEAIYQECKQIPQNVIFSLGNVSASAGYYIAMGGEWIFASPTTITGSIGVFAVRFDFSGLAKQQGIKVGHISTGELGSLHSVFKPMTRRMKINFAESVDRIYDHFKSIVSHGRHMPLQQVETLAQGKVYTGKDAKEVGLIDEIGGLHRAIAYAQQNFTSNGRARIQNYPRHKDNTPLSLLSFRGMIQRAMAAQKQEGASAEEFIAILSAWFLQALRSNTFYCSAFGNRDGINNDPNTIENLAFDSMAPPSVHFGRNSIIGGGGEMDQILQVQKNLQQALSVSTMSNGFAAEFLSSCSSGGIFMAMDENSAIECLFANRNIAAATERQQWLKIDNSAINSLPPPHFWD